MFDFSLLLSMINNADTTPMKGNTVSGDRDLTYTQVIVWAAVIRLAAALTLTRTVPVGEYQPAIVEPLEINYGVVKQA